MFDTVFEPAIKAPRHNDSPRPSFKGADLQDTHKVFVEVAYIEDQRGAKHVHLGKQPTTKLAITKMARQFESKYPDATLHFVYEAGPCGY
jgi:hypothetical protein